MASEAIEDGQGYRNPADVDVKNESNRFHESGWMLWVGHL